DECTNKSHVYLMKHKNQVFSFFQRYHSMVENHWQAEGFKISFVQCDQGLEYLNKDMKNYLDKNGIQFHLSTIYTPQQNGKAECLNRTLQDYARIMIQSGKLSDKFWAEAVN